MGLIVIELEDIEKGHTVWCGGDSGFCSSGYETVKKVSFKFDEDTGEQYKVIHLSESHLFDSKDSM